MSEKKKQCVHCGEIFYTKMGRKKTCSEKCSMAERDLKLQAVADEAKEINALNKKLGKKPTPKRFLVRGKITYAGLGI